MPITEVLDVSAHSLARQPISRLQPWNGTRPRQHDSQLTVTMKLNADRLRLFQALTLPEYMEAWIAPPGAARHPRVSAAADWFRIDLFEDEGQDTCITGSYVMRRRGKLHFTWRKGRSLDAPVSMVAIRLNGDFERTELTLIHSGLTSFAECDWHREFWQESIRRLSGLFQFSR
jgi:uncharacterized protein YndB with AHSA1/START domain